MKAYLLFLLYLTSCPLHVDGLSVSFLGMSSNPDFMRYDRVNNTAHQLFPHEGMVFVSLRGTYKNNGVKTCDFDLKDAYLSTEKDSLYPLYSLESRTDTKVRIKPGKQVNRVLVFEFPEKEKVKELFIEDKRFRVELNK